MGVRVLQIKPGHKCDEDQLRGIDRQHTRIYALVKEFGTALHDGADKERLLLILDEIIERAQSHFAAEERMLRDIEHPSYRFQKTTHRLIVDELMLFHRFVVSNQVLTREQCVHAMDSLLVHHIKDEPAFFAQRGEQAECCAAAA